MVLEDSSGRSVYINDFSTIVDHSSQMLAFEEIVVSCLEE